MTGAFDRPRQFTLVAGTSASLPAWADFAIFRNEAFEHIHRFVVNYKVFIRAELANLRAGNKTPAGGLFYFGVCIVHWF